MRVLAKLLIVPACIIINLPANADDYLVNDLTDIYFDKQAWQNYMGKYSLPVSFSDETRDGAAKISIGGYQICVGAPAIFILQREANGERTDLILDSLTEAQQFNTDMHYTFGFEIGTPGYTPNYYSSSIWVNNMTPRIIAIAYVDREPLPDFQDSAGHTIKAPVPATIKMLYLDYTSYSGYVYTSDKYPCNR